MIRRFVLDALPATPWKNGGGITREIVSLPAGRAAFDWRVSVATIAASGPFSRYDDVDRVIVLLDGDGVQLTGRGIDHRLDMPFAPFAFRGDLDIDCTLIDGPSRDFNVMTRRGQSDVRVLDAEAMLPAANDGVLYAACGFWQVDELALAPGEGLTWADAAHAWSLRPRDAGADARLVAVRWWADA